MRGPRGNLGVLLAQGPSRVVGGHVAPEMVHLAQRNLGEQAATHQSPAVRYRRPTATSMRADLDVREHDPTP